MTKSRVAVALSAVLLAVGTAQAHSPYLLPNLFDLGKRDHVTVQGSFTEEFFSPDVAMKSDDYHVVTPAGALGFIVAEDAVDRYVITAIESWTDNRAVQGFVRTLFNPSRSLSNVVQGRTPWFRARRSLGREPRPNP